MQFIIHEATPTGTIVYTETHNTTTSTYGLFNLPLGGSTNYKSIGTSEFRAVPYAIYAGSNSADADNDPANEVNTNFSLTNTTLSITDSAGTLDVNLASLQGGVGITSGTASNIHPFL